MDKYRQEIDLKRLKAMEEIPFNKEKFERLDRSTFDMMTFDKTKKEEYDKINYPYLWYTFTFGDTVLQIRKNKKGFYIASKKLEDLTLEKEEIKMQSQGLFFFTKEGNFIETCVKWQNYIKFALSKEGGSAAANPS